MLLLMRADQLPDAAEVAKRLKARVQDISDRRRHLGMALIELAQGNLSASAEQALMVAQLAATEGGGEVPVDIEERVMLRLYDMIAAGVAVLVEELRGATSAQTEDSSEVLFDEVVKLASYQLPPPTTVIDALSNVPTLVGFPGPAYLATLLRGAGGTLSAIALTRLPVPPQVGTEQWQLSTRQIAASRPFLWRNHNEAISAGFLVPGVSSVLTFPTGAGKSTLAALKIAASLAQGKSALYLAPTHALVNQVRSELAGLFPGVDIRSSIVQDAAYAELHEGAPKLTVATPEKTLAQLISGSEELANLGVIVFDECHLLAPPSQRKLGRSLDSMLCLLHLLTSFPNADFVLVSALVKNSRELSDWIAQTTRRSCLDLAIDWKPTRQARGFVLYDEDQIDQVRRDISRLYPLFVERKAMSTPPREAVALAKAVPYAFFGLSHLWLTTTPEDYSCRQLLPEPVPLGISTPARREDWWLTPNKNVVAAEIARFAIASGLHVLVFVQNSTHTSSIARALGNQTDLPHLEEDALSPREADLWNACTEEFGGREHLLVNPLGRALAHDSRLIPFERELVESLFRNPSGPKCIVATPTLAQGMNLPADMVLIAGDERYDEGANRQVQIAAQELLNAAGRAGRAGHAATGVVLLIPSTIHVGNIPQGVPTTAWSQFRDDLFGLGDRCVAIEDPLERLLDVIATPNDQDKAALDYVVRRIPGGTLPDDPTSKAFLQRTLAAYRYFRRHEANVYEAKTEALLDHRRAALAVADEDRWLEEVSYQSGSPIGFVTYLAYVVANGGNPLPDTIEGLVVWLLTNVTRNPEFYLDTFGHRLREWGLLDEIRSNLFGGPTLSALGMWLGGASLAEIDCVLTGRDTPTGQCKHGRRFFHKLVPEVGYLCGVFAQVYRHMVDSETLLTSVPISVAVLSPCVKAGCGSPELLALKEVVDRPCSRPALLRTWGEISGSVAPGDKYETFSQTMSRVGRALVRLA